jgi:hypothetical protein
MNRQGHFIPRMYLRRILHFQVAGSICPCWTIASTSLTGRRFSPLTIEGCIKQHQLVHEAVVVGLGKAAPGLLILRSPEAEAENISDDEYLDSIWPIIQEANSHAEAFSRISRDLVAIVPSDAKPLGPTKDP